MAYSRTASGVHMPDVKIYVENVFKDIKEKVKMANNL